MGKEKKYPLVVCFGIALAMTSSWVFSSGDIKSDLPENHSAITTLPVAETQPEETSFVPSERVRLRLNIPATRIDLFVDEQKVKSYLVAVGMPQYPTPQRDFNISMLIWNPWWIPPASDWAKNAQKTPPGPGNPLGVVKMVMEDAVLIHGTNSPRSIGRAASHACLRMLNDEAKDLAWEIQKRYSEKSDPELLEKYKSNRRSSYYVKLLESVPVEVTYQQVERQGDILLLHPNRYGKSGFEDQLRLALSDHPDLVVDKRLLRRLDQMRRQKTVEVSMEQMKAWAVSQPPSSSVGQESTHLSSRAQAMAPH